MWPIDRHDRPKHYVGTVWSIVYTGRPKCLDGRTATFETFGRTDYVVETGLPVDEVIHVSNF